MPQSRRLNSSILLTRKRTTAPCSKQGRGLRIASCCSISPYFKYRRFALIDENDGYVRESAEAERESADYRRATNRGRAIPLEGKQLRAVLDDLDRKYIDVEVEVEFQTGAVQWDTVAGYEAVSRRRRPRRGRRRLPPVHDEFSEERVLSGGFSGDLPCRWEVELLFRELKTQYELDEFDTSDEHVVRILLYAALLSLLVSRDSLDLVTEQADDERCVSDRPATGRTPSLFSSNSVSSLATHHRRFSTG
uniref:ORF II n=1 Tax=Halobacterium salinarum TaxID=2242 RepID=Q47975_HALSI|nr:unnamed protein product [Halobacterium salinarum]